MSPSSVRIQFDVLLKTDGSRKVGTIDTIESFIPDADDVEFCLRWFRENGMEVFATDFGLSGNTTIETFEELFWVKLVPAEGDVLSKEWQIEGRIQIPAPIAPYIDQITVSSAPELF
ncbi:hypothetical protein [Desulfosediminicola flagellatus]|uniref:hypothetical protein n=1 Tax=Desulfosediminicola flagellatus TaxID=2569541 RepID=UPI0010AB962F|nr:hypothetical protein [Desulfosediminicola flagellatus]